MDFSLSEEQIAIKELAYQIFNDMASDERLLDLSRSDKDYDDELWSTLAEQGILALALPESLGGSGLGLNELCAVLEEQGARVAPVPLYANLVLAALPIIQFGTDEQQADLLKPMAAGEKKLTAAIAELGMQEACVKPVSLAANGQTYVLNGMLDCVQDGAVADYVLVPAGSGAEQSIFVLDVKQSGISVTPQQVSLLGKWNARVQLDNVELPASAMIGEMGQGAEILSWLEQRANLAHCALQSGVTESAMRRTAAYTGEREQFGKPIGSFQALAMRMADSYIDVEAIRATYWLALWRLSEGLDARVEVRAAKYWACEAAHRVVCTAQHLHAGIGADIEFPIHRYFLWSKMISYSLGGGNHQLEKLGALLASDDQLGLEALRA